MSLDSYSNTCETCMIDTEVIGDIDVLNAEASLPQKWNTAHKLRNVKDAKLMVDRPELGKGHLFGKQAYTHVIWNDLTVALLVVI